MTTLRKKLAEKRDKLTHLREEIRILENQIIAEIWQTKPECLYSIQDVSSNKCPHGKTIRGIVYCKNPNCHK